MRRPLAGGAAATAGAADTTNKNDRAAGTGPVVASPTKENNSVSSVRNWDELVAQGRELKVMEERIDAEHGNVRWQWGDLALEVAPMGRDGEHNGATERLRSFAAELDVSFESLRQYRNVASAWPAGMRVPAQPWTVHQMFMGREDREHLIARPVDVRTGESLDRWTFRAAQRFLGNKPSPHYRKPPVTVEEKADQARELLADPEVAEATFAPPDTPEVDETARQAERNARTAIAKRTIARASEPAPESPNKPALDQMGRELDASEHIARARKSLGRALDVIQQLDERGELDRFRDHLARRLDAVEVVVDWVRTYLDNGDTSFESELAALLSGEGDR